MSCLMVIIVYDFDCMSVTTDTVGSIILKEEKKKKRQLSGVKSNINPLRMEYSALSGASPNLLFVIHLI